MATSARSKPLARKKGRETTRAAAVPRSDHVEHSEKYVEPMKALAVPEVPAGEWLLEIKFDGYRALAIVDRKGVKLWSRNENVLSEDYPEIVEALGTVRSKDAVIDGEIVALDEQGRPRFQLLQ